MAKMISLGYAHWIIWMRNGTWTKYHTRASRGRKRFACGRKVPRDVSLISGKGHISERAVPLCKQCLEIWLRSGDKT